MFSKLKSLFTKPHPPVVQDTPEEAPEIVQDDDYPSPVTIHQKKSLFISAGHSDSDTGASRYHNGVLVKESDIVLEFRDKLANVLNDKGVMFTMDGVKGENLPLTQAIQLAKKHDISVEFHCNSFTAPQANGVETLSNDKHKVLGEKICQAITDVSGIRTRGAKGEDSGQHSRLGFISKGNGIIVELFFISSPRDYTTYCEYKDEIVEAVANVLLESVI